MDDIERMIDRAGRDKVFSLVESMGWKRGDFVPVHVWQDACKVTAPSRAIGGRDAPTN